MDELKKAIREIPDWPKKGILFYDITTLLKDAVSFQQSVQALIAPYRGAGVDIVVGVEARGYIFAPTVAYVLDAGFVPVRKPGKLPAATEKITYDLEYGTDVLEIHKDAVTPGQKVLIVDDLIATGGTARATVELVQKLGGQVVGLAFLVELAFLNGRKMLKGQEVTSILTY